MSMDGGLHQAGQPTAPLCECAAQMREKPRAQRQASSLLNYSAANPSTARRVAASSCQRLSAGGESCTRGNFPAMRPVWFKGSFLFQSEAPRMSTSWPYPGSSTVVCSMGEHERCKGNCSCDCHLQGHAIAAMRLATPQEIHFERPVEQVYRKME
jgi:hypothetical protein